MDTEVLEVNVKKSKKYRRKPTGRPRVHKEPKEKKPVGRPRVYKEPKEKRPVGRPRINQEIRNKALELYDNDNMTCKDIAKVCGISTRSLYRILDEERADEL